jgi:hypothetical protein
VSVRNVSAEPRRSFMPGLDMRGPRTPELISRRVPRAGHRGLTVIDQQRRGARRCRLLGARTAIQPHPGNLAGLTHRFLKEARMRPSRRAAVASKSDWRGPVPSKTGGEIRGGPGC